MNLGFYQRADTAEYLSHIGTYVEIGAAAIVFACRETTRVVVWAQRHVGTDDIVRMRSELFHCAQMRQSLHLLGTCSLRQVTLVAIRAAVFAIRTANRLKFGKQYRQEVHHLRGIGPPGHDLKLPTAIDWR